MRITTTMDVITRVIILSMPAGIITRSVQRGTTRGTEDMIRSLYTKARARARMRMRAVGASRIW